MTLTCAMTGLALSSSVQLVDQVYVVPPDPTGASLLNISDEDYSGQSFTVGVSGVLASIDLGIFKMGDNGGTLTIDIRRLAAGIPDMSGEGMLARRVLPSDSVSLLQPHDFILPRFDLSVDFSQDNIPVKAGAVLAVVLHSDTKSPYDFFVWKNSDVVPTYYERGESFQGNIYHHPVWYQTNAFSDAMFRTSVLVPEPSMLALIAAATGASFFRRKRTQT